MIEVQPWIKPPSTPMHWYHCAIYYDVLVDGESVARYPSREEAEAYAKHLRKEHTGE